MERVPHEGEAQFEVKMAALIGLRGMKRGDDFQLATNVTDVGKFDDIVYTAGDRRYCLYLKHTQNPGKDKLVHAEMVQILHDSFETYITMADRDKMEYIIYTNKQLGMRLLKHKTERADVDKIFQTSDEGNIFKFLPDNNKENDVYTFLENLFTKRKEYNCLSGAEKAPKVEEIKEFLNKLIICTGQKDEWELDDLIAEEIKNQDEIQVDCHQYKSVVVQLKTPLQNWWRSKKGEHMTPKILRNWLQRAKTAHFTPFVTGLINFSKTKLVTGIKFSDSEISRFQDKLSNKRAVHFRSDALSLCSALLQDWLETTKYISVRHESLQNNQDMLLHAWLGGDWEWLVVLCDSTVQQNDISNTCHKIYKFCERGHSNKRAIILTPCSVQQITNFVPIEHEFKFEQLSKQSQELVLDKKIDFQGCEVKMRSVLQRHGNVGHVLGPELVTELITEETAVNIGGTLQLNTGYYEPRVFKRKIWLHLDILRTRGTYPDTFAVSGMLKNDLAAIVPSGEEVGSFYFEESYVTENSKQNYDVFGKRFIVLKGTNKKYSFLKLCEKHSSETLHWLKYKDGKLLWKETYGGPHNLLNFIDAEKTGGDGRFVKASMESGSCEMKEEAIWNLGERTVLVVAEPGMGKSSTTTQVAWETKLADPTSWVVSINWNDLTTKLQEIDVATCSFDSLFEFLCSAVFPKLKYTNIVGAPGKDGNASMPEQVKRPNPWKKNMMITNINSSLLKQALQNSGNVTVLMDGFDEISSKYVHRANQILSELMNTKVRRVWVTSRPVEKVKLERKLSVIAFGMKKLSYESQKSILLNLCLPKVKGCKSQEYAVKFIGKSLMFAYDLYQDRKFTGTPVFVTMLATALEVVVERQLKSGDLNFPHKFDLPYLYDRLAERIMHIQDRHKTKEDFTNAGLHDDHEISEEISVENLEKCSLLVTLPSELNPLSDKDMQTVQTFVESLKAEKDKTGTLTNVANRPHFVHRTFAEYCTAHWFSKNFESNRNVLQHILFDSSYGIVRHVFDRILATGCPLHCAVLDWDTEAVEILLEEGYEVNAVDSGGRTAMHLIAAQGCEVAKCGEITDSLLRSGSFVDAKDNVMQWTALNYAEKTKNSVVKSRLLEESYKTTESEFIGQREDRMLCTRNRVDIPDKIYKCRFMQCLATCRYGAAGDCSLPT